MRIVCISDTHLYHRRLAIPDGDVLVHAGDVTMRGELEGVEDLDRWLATLPHRHKLVIAGNHDFLFEEDPQASRLFRHATYLQDSGVTIDGMHFWGSPWQPWFHDWAFNLQRGPEIAAKWALIPNETAVLITHGPPHGVLDRTASGRNVGCEELRKRVFELSRLRLHIFGHIHEGYGTWTEAEVAFVNASSCTARYEPVNPPMVIDL